MRGKLHRIIVVIGARVLSFGVHKYDSVLPGIVAIAIAILELPSQLFVRRVEIRDMLLLLLLLPLLLRLQGFRDGRPRCAARHLGIVEEGLLHIAPLLFLSLMVFLVAGLLGRQVVIVAFVVLGNGVVRGGVGNGSLGSGGLVFAR